MLIRILMIFLLSVPVFAHGGHGGGGGRGGGHVSHATNGVKSSGKPSKSTRASLGRLLKTWRWPK